MHGPDLYLKVSRKCQQPRQSIVKKKFIEFWLLLFGWWSLVTVQMSVSSSTWMRSARARASDHRLIISHIQCQCALGSKIKFTPEADINGYIPTLLLLLCSSHTISTWCLTQDYLPSTDFSSGSNNHFPLHISQWSLVDRTINKRCRLTFDKCCVYIAWT